VLALILTPFAFAYTLFMTIKDNDYGTVAIKGMFSTVAVTVRVNGRTGP
jgi:hypothetical protein